jgi:hypothetical protein
MRLSQCEKHISKELAEKLRNCFPKKEFRSYFPANFENISDNYGTVVLVDRNYNQYSIAVRNDIESIPVTLWEYDRALYHYEYNFGIDFSIEEIGNHLEKSIKKEAEKAFTRIASKRTRKQQKDQTIFETRKFNRFLYSVISSLEEYVNQEIISTLNNDEEFKKFLVWQILSGIPHFNYKLPSANWTFTKSGIYDISYPDLPYIQNVSDNSIIMAIETSNKIKDKEKGRPFKYNHAIERLKQEKVDLYPCPLFYLMFLLP